MCFSSEVSLASYLFHRGCCNEPVEKAGSVKTENTASPKPPESLCCGSGCENCVWIQHAEELIKYYGNSGHAKEKILELIEKEVEDECLKGFLNFEIGLRLKNSQ